MPNGYCPNHSTGGRLPEGFVVTPLQYLDGADADTTEMTPEPVDGQVYGG